MMIVKKIPRFVFYGVLTGVLVGTSYIPLPPWALVFCLAPLWYFWAQSPSLKHVFWSGWIAQFVLTLIGFHWIAHTVVEFGHLPWPVGILALLAYAAFSNLHFPLAGLVASLLIRKTPKSGSFVLLVACLTAIFERWNPSIFPWNMGYPWLWANLPIFQLAEVVGFYGLSFFTMLLCALVTSSLLLRKKRFAALAAFMFVLSNGLGWSLHFRLPSPDRSLNVLMVQANIGNFEKFAAERGGEFRLPIVTKYFELTNQGLLGQSKVDLVFWPETAFPANLHPSQEFAYYPSMLRQFVAAKNVPLLTGGYLDEPDGSYYNSLYLLNSNGSVTGRYDKQRLLAFGEYFPGAQYFPFLKDLIPAISHFGRGQGLPLLDFALPSEGVKLGPQICYEGLFDDFARDSVQAGAQIFMNVTNDSWFGHFFESRQHLYMTLARGIEFRRPVVRVTNTGISAAMDASGTVLIKSPELEEWTSLVQVPYQSQPVRTLYSSSGFWFTFLIPFLFFALALAWHRRQS